MIPFPLFEPDKSPFNVAAGGNLVNCLPVADGWGPMPTAVAVSDALPGQCIGAIKHKTATGVVSVFAGTATNLYKLDTSTTPYGWTEVSKVSDGYAVPDGDKWSFTIYGDYIIAHYLGGTPQYWNIGVSTGFDDLAGNPPSARYSWVAGDFLVFGYLENEPTSLQWSALNNCEFWTIGERGADKQTLPSGGQIMGGVGDERGAAIIQRDEIRYMQFSPGSGYTFTIAPANEARGTVSPHSIVQIGQGDFVYLSEDGFFRGTVGQPIGAERVDRWFLASVDMSMINRVEGVSDPFNKVVWWRFTLPDTTRLLLGYDWQLDRWCYSNQDFTFAAALSSPGLTWDGLDGLYSSIDEVASQFNSRLWSGGRPIFAVFDTSDRLCFMTGQNEAATLETSAVEFNSGRRSFVNGGRVVTDGSNFTASVGASDFHGDTFTYKSAVSPSSRSGFLSFRSSGRLHKFKVVIPLGADWSIASGVEVNAGPEGAA